MQKRISVLVLMSMFLISGLAGIVNTNEQNIHQDIIVTESLVEGENLEKDAPQPSSTRAIDLDLFNIYWEKMTQDRNNGFWTTSVISCDLNRDGLMDLVDSSRDWIYASIQNPDGTWTEMNDGLHEYDNPLNPSVYMDVGDINIDGYPDIISINYTSMWGGEFWTPVVYINNNGVDWTPYYDLGFEQAKQSRSIILEDFTNDGILDMTYLGGNPSNFTVYVQDPIGTWTLSYKNTSFTIGGFNSIDSCDYDNDGDNDIIIGAGGGDLYVVSNTDRSGVNWSVQLEQLPPEYGHILSVAHGDLDHNGYIDLVLGIYVSSVRNIIIYSYNGTSWNLNLGNLPYFGEYVDYSIEDINFDGNPDIIASGGGGVDVFLGDGALNFTQTNTGLSSSSDANCVVDIDNNGIYDIIDVDGIYETKGLEKLFVESFDRIFSNLPLGEVFSLDHGDINDDGFLDLLAIRDSGVVTNNINIYYNTGENSWDRYGPANCNVGNIKDGKIGDMDNDGDQDIVFCSSRTNTNILLTRNAGDGTFPSGYENLFTIPGSVGRAYTLDLGDYDHDGDLDILATGRNSSKSGSWDYEVWLLKNEDGLWINETVASGDTIYNTKFANINNDPYLDIITIGGWNIGVRAFLYNSTTNEWDERSGGLPTWSSYYGIDWGDINNDGVTEIIAAMEIYSWNTSQESWDLVTDLLLGCRENILFDLNFDGQMDIIQLESSTGFNVWTNKDNNIWKKGVYQNPDDDSFIKYTIFDYDWDGTQELFLSSNDVGIRVYELDIKQDKTDIVFSDNQPFEDNWLNTLTVSAQVLISDIEGSGVDGNTIEYTTTTTGLGGFGAWTPYNPIPEDAQEITVAVPNLVFAEGDQNFIKWRAKDLVGNGYTESPMYQILIDVSDPFFQNENPPNDTWVNSPSQTLSVEITDFWSGLSAPSIKYKLDTGMGYGEWVSAGETTDGDTLVPSIMAYLHEGINKIIWQASDNVYHTVISDEYIIKLDTQPTVFKSPYPEEGQWMTSNNFKCSVKIFDSGINGSGVNSSNIHYRYSTNGIFEYGPWIGATDLYEVQDGEQTGIHVNTSGLTFLEGTNNYVQFQALDLATNGFTPSPDYKILIDTTPLTFTNPLPSSNDWQASSEVICYISMEDIDGSGVDGTSAEYWVVADNPDPGSVQPNWTKAVTQISAESVTFDAIVELPDGIYNWIKWRAKDVAGNGFTESGWNQIKVDSTGIGFSNPEPAADKWQTSVSVNPNIIVTIDTDPAHLDYSDPQSLQYRYSTTGVLGFGPWIDVSSYSILDSTTLICMASFTLADGTDNYVQWRAIENVSEEYTESPLYQIRIDSTPVTFSNPQPKTNEWQSSSEVLCIITIEDIGGSGVDGTSAEYWVVMDNSNPDSESANWTKALTQINGESVTFSTSVDFPDSVYNWIKWRAKDVAGNGYTESTWNQIKVDSTGIAFSGPSPSSDEWITSTLVSVEIFVTIDTDSDYLDYSNPQSLQYRFSTTGILGFGAWLDSDNWIIIDSHTLICETTLSLIDGTENYIQWRAIENVSEDYTDSATYQINIDTQPITFSNPQPHPDDWQSSNEVVCYITIEDIGGSGVDGTSPEFWIVAGNPNPDSESANWTKTLTQINGESVTFSTTVNLPDGIYNWIKWRAKDVARNGFTESGWNQIKLDSTSIAFSNPTPTSDLWQTSTSVNSSIVVTIDTAPNNLDYSNPESLQYRYSTSGVLGFGGWVAVDGYSVIDNTTLVCEASLSLSEGTDNYIQWRALENVSDGVHSTSSLYQIKVDSTSLSFTNPLPTSNTVNEYLAITCYITIQDSGSGVSGSSIQYRYSVNGSDDIYFTAWNSTVSLTDGSLITVSIVITLENGDDNYLQWSAVDVAGNGPIFSLKYQIKVSFIDTDGDGVSDDDDYDDDNDGVLDNQDAFPLDPLEWQDTDSDGTGDNADNDDDDDGVPDMSDAFPTNPGEYADWDGDGIGDNSDSDDDNDGVPDLQDKFPYNATEWSDMDSDGTGDNTDDDIDGDGYLNDDDAFPMNPSEYSDWDGDGTGDNSDSDDDNDGVPDLQDKFPYNATEWSDMDSDGTGDNTDDDIDGDGYLNDDDAFPMNPSEYSDWDGDGTGDNSDSDDDNDGVPDLQDKFPYNATEWSDMDSDGTGDNTDDDIDGDGYLNDDDAFPTNPAEYADWDDDGIGDNSDSDDDNDGITDSQDEFPYNTTEWSDMDSDGTGDNTDDDIDGDGYLNDDDAFPTNPAENSDWDSDGTGDNSDSDDDNDGVTDFQDKFPYNITEWSDMDSDGIGDNSDSDIDGDGYQNDADAFPKNPNEWEDSDTDGVGDNTDTDDDNDGVTDIQDKFPYDPLEWQDTDNDGTGDNSDIDDDGDGIADIDDRFPQNPAEFSDFDGDNIGDNADPDDDNDGIADLQDEFTFDPLEWMDTDDDDIGNNADSDDDNDGWLDSQDAFPTNPNEWKDSDSDGVGDNTDSDRDGDGFPNTNDAFPDNPTEWYDTDLDGTGNNLDSDDDNDGYNDTIDQFPLDNKEWMDFDGDGIGDNSDSDKDGDGFFNTNDAFLNDPTEWLDTDDDQIGNNVDTDDDGDGYDDSTDLFPMNRNEWIDTDGDSIGDNADLDDDNDGTLDYDDFAPLDASIQNDPNLIRIWGVEFEIGELVIGILMAIGAVILGTIVFTRKKRLYSKYNGQLESCESIKELNTLHKDIRTDTEKERLTNIQVDLLKEQYDAKYMEIRQKELETKLGTLPPKVEETIREVISDKIITEEEFDGMQKWLSRLKESKDFGPEKKEKIQEVLKDWIDDNIHE